ncbi:G-protein coupled receptor 2 [Tyrophagus putrescentiae]|nr:G-protein coupled receptor 2 [Tyrophagus putrescentiae]
MTAIHCKLTAFLFLLFQLSSISPEVEASSAEMVYPMEEINSIMLNISARFKNITNLPFFTIDKKIIATPPPEDIELNSDPLDTSEVLNITRLNFETINTIIEDGRLWRVLKRFERLHLASTLLTLINDLGSLLNSKMDSLSDNDDNADDVSIDHSSSIFWCNQKRFTVSSSDDVLEFNLEHTRLELPFSGLENSTLVTDEPRNISATVVLIRNLTNRLSTEELAVNSRLISLIIEDEAEIELLDEPLRYRLWHLHRLEFFDRPFCAFWDFNSSRWLGKEESSGRKNGGCTYRLDESTRHSSTCECTQLQSNVFAVVVDVSAEEGEILAKSILTYIASGVTCLFLGLAVYILVEYQEVAKGQQLVDSLESGGSGQSRNGERTRRRRRSFRTDREISLKKETNKVSLAINISIYLLLTHVFAMFGFNLSNRLLCNLNTIFQLFVLLATLSFMMLLSAHYVLVQYSVFDEYVHFKYFNWIGYATPAAIIIASLLYIHLAQGADILESLAGEYFCWISSPRYPEHIWIFIYPASALLLMTLIFSSWTFMKHFCCCFFKSRQRKTVDLQLVNALLLVGNFGLPWIAYTFYINEHFGHFAYFFIFFNAIQGLFFFTFQYSFYRLNAFSAQTSTETSRKKFSIF